MQPDQLQQLLKFLTDTLSEGKDFAVDQAPKFVQELLWWRVAEAEFWMIFGLGVFIIAVLIGWAIYANSSEFSKSTAKAGWWALTLGGLILCFLFQAVNLYTIIQVKVAPRVVILEMVRDLIGGHR